MSSIYSPEQTVVRADLIAALEQAFADSDDMPESEPQERDDGGEHDA